MENDKRRISRAEYERRRRMKLRRKRRQRNGIIIGTFIAIIIICVGGFAAYKFGLFKKIGEAIKPTTTTAGKTADNTTEEQTTTENIQTQIEELVAHAEKAAASYDYETALADIQKARKFDLKNDDLQRAETKYKTAQDELVEYTGEVYHVFFHELIVDPAWLFSDSNTSLGQSEKGGHNNVMTTLDEFNNIMQSMYDKGFILVNYNQLYDVSTDANGKKTITEKKLMLPQGRTPVIISEDDVAFYQETRIDVGGYGRKYVLDDNGDVKVYYVDKDGNESVGDYDLLPALETFCREHPDYSYQGARAYIGLTGWEGAFGYRIGDPTNEAGTVTYYKDNAELKANREMVKKISKVARSEGFLFASHSYNHGNQQNYTLDDFKADSTDWKNHIEKYVGNCDTYILPKGNWFLENGWQVNSDETVQRWNLLGDYGFNFIAGVGCDAYLFNGGSYVFQDRYNLDGYSLYHNKDKIAIFCDADKIWDKNRPGSLGLE